MGGVYLFSFCIRRLGFTFLEDISYFTSYSFIFKIFILMGKSLKIYYIFYYLYYRIIFLESFKNCLLKTLFLVRNVVCPMLKCRWPRLCQGSVLIWQLIVGLDD